MLQDVDKAGTKAEQPGGNAGATGQMSPGCPQSVQDTTETAEYKRALDSRMDYLHREMEKIYEARNYINTEDWQKRARVHDTINKAARCDQD